MNFSSAQREENNLKVCTYAFSGVFRGRSERARRLPLGGGRGALLYEEGGHVSQGAGGGRIRRRPHQGGGGTFCSALILKYWVELHSTYFSQGVSVAWQDSALSSEAG